MLLSIGLLFVVVYSVYRLMHSSSCDCQFPEAQELESKCIQYISELTSANHQIPNLAVVYARLAALNDILCNYSVARRWALKALECVSLQLPVKSIVFVFGQASKSCVVSKKFRKAESIARGAVNISRYIQLISSCRDAYSSVS